MDKAYSPNSSKSCIDLKRQSVHSVSKPRSARAAGLSATAAGAVRGAGGSETSHPVQREERRGERGEKKILQPDRSTSELASVERD